MRPDDASLVDYPSREGLVRRCALRIAALGLWTGLLAAWGLVFVPALFEHLADTGTAAVLVGATLARVDAAGIALGLGAAALGLASRPRGIAERLLAAAPLVGVACHVASLFWLGPEIRAIREAAGGAVGLLPPDDPRIPEFRMLHALSLASFGLAAACAVAALGGDLLIARSASSRVSRKTGNP